MALREVFAGEANFTEGFVPLVTASVQHAFGTADPDDLTILRRGSSTLTISIDEGFDTVYAEGDLDAFASELQVLAARIAAGYAALLPWR